MTIRCPLLSLTNIMLRQTSRTALHPRTRGQSFISHLRLPMLFSSPSLFLHAPLTQAPGPDTTMPPVRGTRSSEPGGPEGTNKGPHHYRRQSGRFRKPSDKAQENSFAN